MLKRSIGKDFFRPVFGCCELQMLVEICFFNIFCAEKAEKVRKGKQIEVKFSKKTGFKVCTRRLVEGYVHFIRSPSFGTFYK